MVDKEKFGDRHTCYACGCKFYDMHRNPPTCPKCGADTSRPPKQTEEVVFTAEVEEEEEEIVEEIDEKNIDVDSDEEVRGGEEEGDEA